MSNNELTPAQRNFLTDYIADICHGDSNLTKATEEEFVRRVSNMEFDGPADKKLLRVARNLQRKGVFAEMHIHQPSHICVRFSALGAKAIFLVMHNE